MQNADLTKKSGSLWMMRNLLSYIKISQEILAFGNVEIEKNKLYHNKAPIFLYSFLKKCRYWESFGL